MKRWLTEGVLLVACAMIATLADQRLRSTRIIAASGRPLPNGPVAPKLFDVDALAAASDAVAARDPFRLPAPPPPVAPPPSGPPRPSLVLKAIVGGPPWQAVLAGIPGQSGDAVVSAGDRMDALLVSGIKRDTVFVRWADTTWALTLGPTQP